MLRGKNNPSVSALLARRASEVAGDDSLATDANPAYQDALRHYDTAISLGLILAQWSPKAASPSLKMLMDRVLKVCAIKTSKGTQDQIGAWASRLTIARMQGGAPDAASDYAAFVKGISPSWFTFHLDAVFAPMCEFPDDPVLQHVAEVLFKRSGIRLESGSAAGDDRFPARNL